MTETNPADDQAASSADSAAPVQRVLTPGNWVHIDYQGRKIIGMIDRIHVSHNLPEPPSVASTPRKSRSGLVQRRLFPEWKGPPRSDGFPFPSGTAAKWEDSSSGKDSAPFPLSQPR